MRRDQKTAVMEESTNKGSSRMNPMSLMVIPLKTTETTRVENL